MTTLTTDERASLESLRDFLADSDYADRGYWLGAIDRALGRFTAEETALERMLHPRPRKYRYCESHGAQKALVAATPPGGVLKARNYDHAQVLRSAARHLGRRVSVRQVTPGKPERHVTLLD